MEGAGVGLLLLVFCVYFLPWLVALARRKTGRAQVFIVNLVFGWTFLGWIIALIMAFGSDNVTNVTVVQTVGQDKNETKREDK